MKKPQILSIDDLVALHTKKEAASQRRAETEQQLEEPQPEPAPTPKKRSREAARSDYRLRTSDVYEWDFRHLGEYILAGPKDLGPAWTLAPQLDIPDFGFMPYDPFVMPNRVVWAHSLGRSPPDKLSLVWDEMLAHHDAHEEARRREQERRAEREKEYRMRRKAWLTENPDFVRDLRKR